jgi:antitoxin component YwqK of YwqJK toxin-antitoxin module
MFGIKDVNPMRCVFILTLLLVLHNCTAQKSDTLVKYLNDDLAFTTRFNKVYKAIVYKNGGHWQLQAFYPDGATLFTASFSDKKLSVRDGEFIIYYTAGKPAMKGNYKNNKRGGIWQSWYETGHIKDSGMISDNILTGRWINWYEHGGKKIQAEFSNEVRVPGSQYQDAAFTSMLDFPKTFSFNHGIYQTWYSNGNVKDSGSMRYNLKHGYWKSFYENGFPESEGLYRNDTLDGDWTYYYENGKPSTKETYRNNRLAGLRCFDTTGKSTGSSCSVKKPPVLLGTPFDWDQFLLGNIQWSKKTLRVPEEGNIKIRIKIGKHGRMTEFSVTDYPHELVKDDVEKVLAQMTDWSPAVLHNRPIDYTLEYSFPFLR